MRYSVGESDVEHRDVMGREKLLLGDSHFFRPNMQPVGVAHKILHARRRFGND